MVGLEAGAPRERSAQTPDAGLIDVPAFGAQASADFADLGACGFVRELALIASAKLS
jgi:hypothetical protein